jgi:hypothetical protein
LMGWTPPAPISASKCQNGRVINTTHIQYELKESKT